MGLKIYEQADFLKLELIMLDLFTKKTLLF